MYFIDEVYGLEKTKDKVYCTGTGAAIALGAAHALGIDEADEYEDAIEILEQAVKIAIRFDINSGGQVQVALQTKAGKNHIAFLD